MAEPATAWEGTNVQSLSMETEDHRRHLRMLEALLFAADEPLSEKDIAARMPEGIDLGALLHELQAGYAGRGVNLRRTDDRWAFRTAEDLAFVFKREVVEQRKLSRAAIETLAVIAYHQPVTRAEIEEVRGVSLSRGTLDVLLEAGWIKLRGRRRAPGRPVTFGTTADFLDHFGLESIGDLPGLADLKAAGLLEAMVDTADEARPVDDDDLTEDEDPLELDFSDLETADDLPDEEDDGAERSG
jgi:segregation and condensation protein B